MTKKFRIISLSLIFSFLTSLSAAADSITSVTRDYESDTVTVSGTYDKDINNPRFVLKAEDSEGNVSAFRQNNNYSGKSGVFSFEIKLGDNGGKYNFFVNSNVFDKILTFEEYEYFSKQEVSELTDTLNQKSETEFAELFKENINKFALDETYYKNLSDKNFVIEKTASEKPYNGESKISDIQKTFFRYSIIQALNEAKTTDTVKSVLEGGEDILGISSKAFFEDYNALKTTKAGELYLKILSLFSDKAENTEDVMKHLKDAVILTSVKTANGFGDVRSLLKKYEETVKNSDIAAYFSMSDTSAIDLELVGKDFENLSKLREKIKTLLTAKPDPTPSDRPSSASGSSGSSASYSVASNTPVSNTAAVPELKNGFSDLDTVPWAKNCILNLYTRGIVNGKSEGIFAPLDTVTRAEYVKMLVLAFDVPYEGKSCNFEDISGNSWCAPYVGAAVSIEAVFGQGDGRFGADMPITRQDMAVMAYRFGRKCGISFGSKGNAGVFSDRAAIDDYAVEAIEYLVGASVINGMGDGTYGVSKSCTRAEAACITDRIITLMNGGTAK